MPGAEYKSFPGSREDNIGRNIGIDERDLGGYRRELEYLQKEKGVLEQFYKDMEAMRIEKRKN